MDADGQSSLTISFGKEPFDFEHSICDILKRDPIGIEECIYNIKDNLDIIPDVYKRQAVYNRPCG